MATTATQLFAPLDNDGQQAAEENPQEATQPPPAFGPDNRDLPEELQHALLSLIQEAQRQDLYQRRVEVCRDRRNRFYERGIQHVFEDARTGLFVQATPGAWVPDPSGDGQLQCGQYIADYNIFGRALQIIISKLTENPVGVDFQPDSGDSSVDLQAAQAAETYRIHFDRRNDMKDIGTAIVRMMGLSGRTIAWTRTVADAQRWGTDEQGQPRKIQTTTVYGTLETKVPIMAQSLGGCPYVLITEDPHLYTAKMEEPHFADKIVEQGDDGIADTQFERMARIGALQGNSASFQITDSYAFYVERKHAWLRPAMFQSKELDCLCECDEFHGATLREALNQLFPQGAYTRFIGQQYVASRPVSMDDELAVDFPYAGDGMSRMAIMDPAVVIQDRFNDDENLYAEWKDFGSPSTWVNGEKADIAAINDQVASPFCYRPWKSAVRERPLGDQFYREPQPEIPATFMEHTEYMATQLLQYVLAIPSAVQGAGMPDQKTASGYTAALQQALGQLGVIYGAVQRLMSTVYRQAALSASRDDQEGSTLVVPTANGAQTLNMSDLGKGHFLAHPDVDSGYPESTAQKRATIMSIFDLGLKDPMIIQALTASPKNWAYFCRTLGVSEIEFPEAKVWEKQQAEIEQLVQQPPIEPSPEAVAQATEQHAAETMVAKATAQPAPPPFDPQSLMRSSITPDELDYHDWEFEACKEKLSDWSFVQQQIVQGNSAGIQNIRLHALEHQKYIQQAAAAQMAMAQAMQPAQAGAQSKPAKTGKPETQPKPQPAAGGLQ